MRCVNCGTELLPGKKFCHACGTAVQIRCPSCASEVDPSFRFCPECGSALPAPSPPVSAAPSPAQDERQDRLSKHIPVDLADRIRGTQSTLTGERKLVTVLFCDLVGSTAIAERLDPEEYRDLLDQYLELAFHEIYRFDGIVNQLAGDGMMSLFGAPVAHEDAPYRAVRAALEIRSALDGFNQTIRERRGFELRARIGINTGPVVVGTVGNDLKMDYTAIGDTTNLAARLQSLAEPGTILMSESTQRMVRGFFEVDALGPLTVKGKSEPVTAYRVLGTSAITNSLEAAEARGLTPLVGRAEEVAQLVTAFERVRANHPQVVTISADTGSGKSRLLYEFRIRIEHESVLFLEGRCSSLTQQVPYTPFIGMLRQFFAIGASDTPEAARDKIAAKVRMADPELDRIYPFLCRMLSVPTEAARDLPPDEVKRQTFNAIAELVMSLSERAPVVLVIEDLHWIDPASREMLELAVSTMSRARLLLILTHRPDFQANWRPQVALTQLTLQPLGDEESFEVIRAIVGGPLPAELERLIVRKAEGSPFFTEEITRSLVEEGYIQQENGGHRLTRPLEEILIPGTVREVIAARLDRLGGPAKRTAQVASVLGRQFRRGHLEELLRKEWINVAPLLEELEGRGILHRKNVFSVDEYRFGESLTQEVAYEGLLLRDRRQLHERIAQLLAADPSSDSTDRLPLLAFHYSRSDNRRSAVDTLLRAAAAAEKLPSYPAAADLYRQAWEMGDAALEQRLEHDDAFKRLAMAAALNLCRMAVIYTAPDSVDVERAARRGSALAEELADTASAAGFCSLLGMIVMSGSRDAFPRGLALVEEGLELARRADLGAGVFSVSRGVAFGYLFDGRFDRARDMITPILEDMQRRGEDEKLSDFYFGARWSRNLLWQQSDEFANAAADALEMYELSRKASNRTSTSGAATLLGQLHFLSARYAEAKTWADQSLTIAEAIGNMATVRSAAAIALASRVELGESVDKARYIAPIEQSFAMASNLSLYIRLLAEVLVAVGELDVAERAAEIAYERAGGRLREMLATLALGEVLSHRSRSRWSDARRFYERSLTLALEIGQRSTVGFARLGLAELAALGGEGKRELPSIATALAIFRALGMTRYERRAERLLATASPGVSEAEPA